MLLYRDAYVQFLDSLGTQGSPCAPRVLTKGLHSTWVPKSCTRKERLHDEAEKEKPCLVRPLHIFSDLYTVPLKPED